MKNEKDFKSELETTSECACGGCDLLLQEKPFTGKNYSFRISWANHPNARFKGYTPQKSAALIREGFKLFNRWCGAKFYETTNSKASIICKFVPQAHHNGIMSMSSGSMYLSQTRAVTDQVIKNCIQHEIGHFLGLKASPAGDQWAHCPTKTCIHNVNGTGTVYCSRCLSILRRKYGS
jgi:hypothetical protein